MGIFKKIKKKVKSVGKFDVFAGKKALKDIGKNPERLLYGSADPLSTKVWNKVLGTNDKPILNQYGGPTKDTFQAAADKGMDLSGAAPAHAIAQTVAQVYGGKGALSALGGAAGISTAGNTGKAAGALGALGGSKLSDSLEPAPVVTAPEYDPGPGYTLPQAQFGRSQMAPEDYMSYGQGPEFSYYAEGGAVDDDAYPGQRFLAGLKSQLLAADPEDPNKTVVPLWHNLKRSWNLDSDRREGKNTVVPTRPGIVDEFASLPVLWRDFGPLAAAGMDKVGKALSGQKHYDNMEPEGNLGELLGELFTAPTWAEEAEKQAGENLDAARAEEGVGEPHGFWQNLEESGGQMFGQLPVPGSVFNKLKKIKAGADATRTSKAVSAARKVAGSGLEYLSPTVDPKLSNYAAGAGFGGVTGAIGDYLNAYAEEPEDPGFAKGGKVDNLVELAKTLAYRNRLRKQTKDLEPAYQGSKALPKFTVRGWDEGPEGGYSSVEEARKAYSDWSGGFSPEEDGLSIDPVEPGDAK